MRIAVNARLLLHGKLEGIGWFAHETLSRICKAHPEHTFIFLFDRPWHARFIYAANVLPVQIPPPTRHPLLYWIWFQWRIPAVLRKYKADLFLSPDGFLSTRTKVPQLAVVHDLNFEHYPDDLPWAYRRYYRTWFPRFARVAERIVTVSEFSKQDLLATYGVPADRVDVVYNGVGAVFRPSSPDEIQAARREFAGDDPYLVCVGSLHPRKNIARLLSAFDLVVQARPDIRLVVVGEAFWWDKGMKKAWDGLVHKDRVAFTGRLDQPRLRSALGGAEALAFLSYFEGFGIPVAEAMRCGVPVVAARATSLPEVAGDAAIYCDPFDIKDIASALEVVLSDHDLRSRMTEAGLERSAKFTWARTADGLWASIEKLLQ
ncbi:MAG: glycosyltransferase family 4 protein [Flavobacteriales bacterium]|jgi:glycosyltransferase involved in cell wall biosynthesis|nr:glycosyltransferase family 4 protein [Flavobacteriales bacterium]MBK7270163.1 glycosyltransferase family 4 protein [Flavobacteriales bacterium]MBK7751667.1 glycosyltransferase family 4 protein [Flavobacteriales bacterium]MBK9076402.1 glycosyltransferase family 4 protein [Flavobacteriales bacterium]MBK9539460.1 glycosyltransferase family 4 protein [Flavobacteriales bacterium]